MADIYRPDYTRDNRFRTYLNQYSATSGTVPSASLLDRIVQSELDAAAKNFYRSKEIQRQKQRDAIERMDRERALESQKTQNLAGGITKLATTGLGLMGKGGLKSALATGKTLAGDAVNKATTTASGLLHHTTGGMFGTAPQATTAATETLPVVPAVAETATGLGSPVADAALQAAMDAGIGNVGSAGVADLGATLASQAPEVATAIGTGSAPILPDGGGMMPAMSELTATGVGGASTAASEAAATQAAMDAGVGNAVGFDAGATLAAEGGSAAGTTASALSSVAGPVAIIGAAEAARNMFGGAGKDWNDKFIHERAVDSPATAGMLATLMPLPGLPALFSSEGTLLGDMYKNLSKAERLAMAPIDWLFGSK